MPIPSWLTLTRPDPNLNWFEKLENKRRLVIGTILFVVIAIIAATSLRLSWAYDIYWHLQTGKDWIENGLSPWVDHYSFTFSGAEIRTPAALFDAGIYYLVEWLGLETGLKLYKFAAMSIALCLAALWLRLIRAPVVAYILVLPFLGVLLQLRAIERPELVGYSLLLLGLILYERARTLDRISTRALLPIALLLVIWTNYHGAILGYVLFFGLFVDLALRLFHSRAPSSDWFRWAAWGAIMLAAGFIKPNFAHPVLEMLAFSGEWKSLIIEYRSPQHLLGVPSIYGVLFIAAITLFLLFRQKKVGYLIVSCIFFYHAFTTVRVVVPAGIVIVCLFGLVLRDERPAARIREATRKQSALLASSVWILVILSIGSSVSAARQFIQSNVEISSRYPKDMIDYMRSQGMLGRIFNEYGIGGYLIWGLDGDAKVYIDGRTGILYPIEHYRRYETAMKSAEAMRIEIEAYDIESAVFLNHPEVAKLMAETGVMALDYVDMLYALYRRNEASLSVMGYLWGMPACWREELSEKIQTERLHALLDLPPLSPLIPFAELVASYTAATDQAAKQEILFNADLQEVVARRFIGYRALADGYAGLAVQILDSLPEKGPRDLLAAAWANVKLGNFSQAEHYLDTVTRLDLKQVHPNEVVILHHLLQALSAAGQLQEFDKTYVAELRSQVLQIDPKLVDGDLSTSMLCTARLPALSSAAER